ncbi:MAG: RagB/SusD family nutrient uptake outer membrane protein [Cyclobacteriaceae bacterium]|nr:RagB/SusD family nutrient uptake outer membrane protein [Cyclobacteriaceae bacterium]MCH8515920.1 RagB/SusD family nutrient uptake outer membrane protein [Cyclobacteriaceae bacterium]
MKNKSILQITAFVFCVGMLGACDILDLEPQQSIPAESAVVDRQGVERALLGCYSIMQGGSYYGGNFLIVGDLASDNADATATGQSILQIGNNAIVSDNTIVEGMWNTMYSGINRVNTLLQTMEGIDELSDNFRNTTRGELLFLRALHHFNLVLLFGDVPIATRPTLTVADIEDLPRRPISEVIEVILEDLEDAEELMSPSTQKARASQGAASALLARVHLYAENFQLAADYANKTIEEYGYQLEDNFTDLFPAASSSESIFEIFFNEQDRNRIAQTWAPISLQGTNEVSESASLVAAFSDEDDRRDVTLWPGSGPYAVKYRDIANGTDRVYVVRLAEMFLIRAEARARGNIGIPSEIRQDIDRLRNRAGLENIAASVDLIDAIENERRLEFAKEGHRWFDLIRLNRAIDRIETVNSTNQLLFPIPLTEIIVNSEISQSDQNPGY